MTQPEPADPFLTTNEVALELRCSDDSVLRAIKRGSLVAFKDGRLVRVRRSALDAYIERQTTGGEAGGRRHRRSRP